MLSEFVQTEKYSAMEFWSEKQMTVSFINALREFVIHTSYFMKNFHKNCEQ